MPEDPYQRNADDRLLLRAFFAGEVRCDAGGLYFCDRESGLWAEVYLSFDLNHNPLLTDALRDVLRQREQRRQREVLPSQARPDGGTVGPVGNGESFPF